MNAVVEPVVQEDRKLATIRRISEVKPIEGADAIECVVVDGWEVVSKKGEFKPGDLCVYFEIDSVLPICEEFEFLRKGCFVKRDWLPAGEGFRLKTVRLRGQVSQGLVVPVRSVSALMEDPFYRTELRVLELRPDVMPYANVTDVLGVVKWDPPLDATLSGKARGNFPSFLRKTDQERVQNLRNKIPPGKYRMEEKLDGSSTTVFFYEGRVGVCSRNLELEMENSESTFVKTVLDSAWDGALQRYGKNIALQAELCGPGIQGNKYKLAEHRLYVFDVFLIDEQRHATEDERAVILNELRFNETFEIREAPFLGYIEIKDSSDIQPFLALAEGKSMLNGMQEREGDVFKRLEVERGNVFSFKAISNKFLLKTGE